MRRLALLLSLVGLLPLLSLAGGVDKDFIGAMFTGVYSDSGVDDNNDGYFECLLVTAEVEVADAGTYTVTGLLNDESGDHQCARSNYQSTAISSNQTLECEEGKHTFSIKFSGEDIRAFGVNSRYYAVLMLDHSGPGSSLTTTTRVYSYKDFRETPAEIGELVSHQGVDTNGDGLFELIETRVEVSVFRSGLYDIVGRLFGRGILSEPVFFSDSLTVGLDTLKFELPVHKSEVGKIEGALTFDLELDNRKECFGGQGEYKLWGYSSTQFRK